MMDRRGFLSSLFTAGVSALALPIVKKARKTYFFMRPQKVWVPLADQILMIGLPGVHYRRFNDGIATPRAELMTSLSDAELYGDGSTADFFDASGRLVPYLERVAIRSRRVAEAQRREAEAQRMIDSMCRKWERFHIYNET